MSIHRPRKGPKLPIRPIRRSIACTVPRQCRLPTWPQGPPLYRQLQGHLLRWNRYGAEASSLSCSRLASASVPSVKADRPTCSASSRTGLPSSVRGIPCNPIRAGRWCRHRTEQAPMQSVRVHRAIAMPMHGARIRRAAMPIPFGPPRIVSGLCPAPRGRPQGG